MDRDALVLAGAGGRWGVHVRLRTGRLRVAELGHGNRRQQHNERSSVYPQPMFHGIPPHPSGPHKPNRVRPAPPTAPF